MDHAIESLREHIKAAADMLREAPDDGELKAELRTLVKAVNVLEKYEYGHHVTKYQNIIGGIAK